MNEYKYRSLDPEAHEIRLLKVQKSSDESAPITLELRHTNLHDGQPFVALSYTWGDESPTTQIATRDGATQGFVSVRRNLFEYLKEARQSAEEWSSEWIWIDQISINQDDHNERGHQVRQMRKLYSSARMVLVWPWSWPESIAEPEQPTPATSQLDMNKLLCDDMTLTTLYEGESKSGFPISLLSHLTFGLFVRLLKAPYWMRLWIIQEIALAPQCFIVISGNLWKLEYLIGLTFVVRKCQHSASIDTAAFVLRLVALWFDRDELPDGSQGLRRSKISGYRGWSRALSFSANTNCTVPLDRVYGVMGLLQEDLHIQPDYNITETELLRRILYKQMTAFSMRRVNRWDRVYLVLRGWQAIGLQLQQHEDSPWDLDLDVNNVLNRSRIKRIARLALEELDLPMPPFTYHDAVQHIHYCWNIPQALIFRELYKASDNIELKLLSR